MKMRKSEQSTMTREALLDAAQELFAKSGFDATSVAAICETVDVSKGAFYYHFTSKQALFFELMQRWLDGLEVRLSEIETQADHVPEKLLSMAQVVGEVLEVGGPQLSIYLEFWNQALRDPDLYSALSQPFDDFLDFFSGLLQGGMERGVIKSTNAGMTARVITALGIGLLFQGLLSPDAADWNEVTEFGLGIVLEGLNQEVTR
jgi:AcrR family transcriptional regulator